jgi:hypothetical protein
MTEKPLPNGPTEGIGQGFVFCQHLPDLIPSKTRGDQDLDPVIGLFLHLLELHFLPYTATEWRGIVDPDRAVERADTDSSPIR